MSIIYFNYFAQMHMPASPSPSTTGNRTSGSILTVEKCIEETCEWVDDEAEDHGDDWDKDPVREPLVLHAAIDGNGRLVALEQKHRQEDLQTNTEVPTWGVNLFPSWLVKNLHCSV